MSRKQSGGAKKPPEPLPGERKVRAHVYLPPDRLAYLDAIVEELPGVSSRNGAIEYLVELYKTRKEVRDRKGLKGPVPLYEPEELIV